MAIERAESCPGEALVTRPASVTLYPARIVSAVEKTVLAKTGATTVGAVLGAAAARARLERMIHSLYLLIRP